MHNPLRSIRTFGLYLLPASLLATAGALLIVLLYYPTPDRHPAPAAIVNSAPRTNLAEAMLALWLAEVVRQHEAEQQSQARILMHYSTEGGWPAGESARLYPSPRWMMPGNDSRRPPLIRL